MFQLSGKQVAITGAARGIGLAIAQACSAQGAMVALLDLDIGLAQAAAEQCGSQAHALPLDVGAPESVAECFAMLASKWGGLDVLVNNAAIISTVSISALEEVEWQRVLNINLGGVYRCCKAALPLLRQRGQGRIINIASVAGKRGGGLLGSAAYSASKAGVLGFSKALARELAGDRITVNTVVPGPVQTDLTAAMTAAQRDLALAQLPLKRFGQPTEIAAAVLFLASDEAAFLTGTSIDVDGGLLMQ